MSAIVLSNQYKVFESYAEKCGIQLFVIVKDKKEALHVRGDVNTGRSGVNLMERRREEFLRTGSQTNCSLNFLSHCQI